MRFKLQLMFVLIVMLSVGLANAQGDDPCPDFASEFMDTLCDIQVHRIMAQPQYILRSHVDDWIELQMAPARTIAMHNPSAVCELDWMPTSSYKLSYDVCIVDGYYFPGIMWLVISVNDTGYVGRKLSIGWIKDDLPTYGYPIRHYQADESHVAYLGFSEQAGNDFDAIQIVDIDAGAVLELDLTSYSSAMQGSR